MDAIDSTDMTHPAESTGHGREDTRDGIRWVFPESLAGLTPISMAPVRALGRVTLLDRTPITLGRSSDCGVCLGNTATSRHHAEITGLGPLLMIRDLGSTNGVFVNGARVHEALLTKGSVVRLGECVGVVIKVSPSADPSAFAEFAQGLFGGPVLRACVDLARSTADCDLPIILDGETGTGKEIFARAIHHWSRRAGPFVAVNCSALPEALAEAELFGYKKGAFTGAQQSSLGHFRAAEGGTLLLDEILDMPMVIQGKVLRALEQKEVMPLGDVKPVPTNVRVIVAAQSSLREAAARHSFRTDLVARLEGVTIRLPPLRERIEEIPWLFQRLLRRHSAGQTHAIDARLIEQLCLYDWPYNVRELDLLVRRLLTLHGHEPLLKCAHVSGNLFQQSRRADVAATSGLAAAPAWKREGGDAVTSDPEVKTARAVSPLTHEERNARDLRALIEALRAFRGNVAQAAARTGISRQRAYRLIGHSDEIRLQELRVPCIVGSRERAESDEAESPGNLVPR